MKAKPFISAMAVTLIAIGVRDANSQSYPTKPVRLIVPFAAGGPNDVIGRVVAQKLTEQMGQTVIVDNRPGAGGAVGTAVVKNAPPDGHTILISGTSSLAKTPSPSQP